MDRLKRESECGKATGTRKVSQMVVLKCSECLECKWNVAYSIDWNGLVCGPCDEKLYQQYMAKIRMPTLTWGGLR